MTVNALIGHTGFVGGTIARGGWNADEYFNSQNIKDMQGRRYQTVICAGISATKWLANKDPETDWQNINLLLGILKSIDAQRFVLVSTVDVYPTPIDVVEADEPTRGEGMPYGRHRLEVEYFVRENFRKYNIVRLPALFGDGLRKNALFDLLTENMVNQISPNGSFQWYPTNRLLSDIGRVIEADLPIANLAVEPVRTDFITKNIFPRAVIGTYDKPSIIYDMRTQYNDVLGGAKGYILSGAEIIDEMRKYVRTVTMRGGKP